jgi:2-polyprenyl-3-methyl-5-hydroxy-6-metoxy-1,4-benzoquinol methylase
MNTSIQNHWDTVYETKKPEEVSWTQEIPKTSLDFIHTFKLDKSANIIDIGGGDSKLVDYLIDEGFTNISVLDISAKALEKAKLRLGEKAKMIHWIVSDITEFKPEDTFDVWHDRATFHFLTTADQIAKYMNTARKAVSGYMTIGTFSENGPEKCSGLTIKQYSEKNLVAELQNGFEKIKCITEDHITPFNTKQNFLFCSFQKNKIK